MVQPSRYVQVLNIEKVHNQHRRENAFSSSFVNKTNFLSQSLASIKFVLFCWLSRLFFESDT